jgi:uncharacterized protein
MPDAVSDSSPLIHLAKIEVLSLISRLYSRVLIPAAVWREVVEESDGRPGALEMQRAVAAGWMVKQPAENKALVIALRQTLDTGEAEAIPLATELQPEVVLLDDKLACQMARRLGVPVTGTLGVLLRAKQVGLVEELKPGHRQDGDFETMKNAMPNQAAALPTAEASAPQANARGSGPFGDQVACYSIFACFFRSCVLPFLQARKSIRQRMWRTSTQHGGIFYPEMRFMVLQK